MRNAVRKQRRTFSLDPELVKYLDKVRREGRISSASSALEQILWESKRRRERLRQEGWIANYYNSLDEAEVAEQSEWGNFAETQFPGE
jgi:hypothetical protein